MNTARQIAFEVLLKINRDNAFSNIAIDSKLNDCQLDSRDKSFATAIVYGALERKITIDYNISLYLTQPIKKLKPQVLVALRMGAFQLLFMDKIPASAAINESVNIVKKNSCAFASGLVNAVLRKISLNALVLPKLNKDKTLFYSVKYSCPEPIIKLWINYYGEENAVKLLESSIGPAPTVIRVNTLKTNTNKLLQMLIDEGFENARVSDEVENSIVLEKTGSIEKLSSYKEGLFHVQDTASQLCCKALNVKSGDTVFDMCAAPGGKSFTIAQLMNNNGKLFSFDLYSQRTRLIEQGAKRLGITILKSEVLDASKQNDIGMADKILCDVPCSGLGIIRRKPEIKYKSLEDIDNLPNIQYDILRNASRYLKKDGILLYSTCSLNKQENDFVCDRFLEENKNFKPIRPLNDIKSFNDNSNYLTLMPHINNSDGFFIATFVRTE